MINIVYIKCDSQKNADEKYGSLFFIKVHDFEHDIRMIFFFLTMFNINIISTK